VVSVLLTLKGKVGGDRWGTRANKFSVPFAGTGRGGAMGSLKDKADRQRRSLFSRGLAAYEAECARVLVPGSTAVTLVSRNRDAVLC
jgi:hypothetical protein